MNSNEMFDAMDKATGLNLREYVSRPRPIPACNVNDFIASTFCRCMDAGELIAALDDAEKRLWAARKAVELRRDYERDNPSDASPFRF